MAKHFQKRAAKRANKPNPREDRNSAQIIPFDPDASFALRKPSRTKKSVQLLPRNLAQEDYLECLQDQSRHVVFAMGPAGCGKTLLATLYAIDQLQKGAIDKIIIARPNVQNGEDLGTLPGGIIEKLGPSCAAVLDIFKEHYPVKVVEHMLEEEQIVLAPIGILRGRTFKNAIVILEETQNCTPNQMMMVLTRIGENCRIFVNGDIKQHDRGFEQNGLKDFLERFEKRSKSNSIAICRFAATDVERHPIIEEILHIYGE